MYVKIGKYKNWIGPYQIADKVFFWVEKYPELKENCEQYEKRWDYRAKDWFADFLCYGFQKKDVNNKYFDDNRKETWFYRLLQWIHNKQKRTEIVRIDKWDTWNMDHTLALIVLPMLKQLQEEKHGSPFVDDEDVPEELRSTAAPPKINEWDTDGNHFKRWDYVLGEMIWAFEQHAKDDEEDFWIEEPKGMYFEPCEDDPKLSTMKYDKEGVFNHDAYNAHHERKKNGFRLFGKYYQGLWD
jgi:hypothetical protein